VPSIEWFVDDEHFASPAGRNRHIDEAVERFVQHGAAVARTDIVSSLLRKADTHEWQHARTNSHMVGFRT
jgi:hypothetical protein